MKKTKITVVGSGYVGMSLAVLLGQHNDVTLLDIDPVRVDKINKNQSTVIDNEIEAFLVKKKICISATLDKKAAYKNSNFVVVATPTNYNSETNNLDTSSVDGVVEDVLELNSDALIVIKSTLPVGHTKSLQEKHNTDRVIFSPEFLREGQALKDNLYPSRIIIGTKLAAGKAFAKLLIEGAQKKDVETLFINSTEAEAVKLFANSYLAMRVSFFNELDSFALANELNTHDIIRGICLDNRINEGYNNPSFGYGGYCLPKDTKQLLTDFKNIPQSLIKATVKSNSDRKDFIAESIMKLKPKVVGIHRLVMKKDSNNFRESAIQDIMNRIKREDIEIVIYEPSLTEDKFQDFKVIDSLDKFKTISDIIISNRMSMELNDVTDKVFTRDIFGLN
tara:strand:+ start:1173 stop:2348 length:1176 start_codon:yes stop_codon:yes gene_type:complete